MVLSWTAVLATMRNVFRVLALVSMAIGCAALLPAAAPATPDSAADDPDTDYTAVDEHVRQRMAATRTPGLAYAVVGPDRIEHVATWGQDGDRRPVTADTPFLWGSVGKTVTATVVMTLVEAGTVELDRPVRGYLPEFTLADANLAGRITVRHLLEQTSGIPDSSGITDCFDDTPQYARALAELADAEPIGEPGQRHEYTSANYLVLGALVEAVTGKPYTEYLGEVIIDPLRMTHSVTSPAQAAAELPKGHRYLLGRPVAWTTPFDPTGPSYGYLGGSVTDLAHFAMAQLAGGRFGSTRLLEPESVERMHTGSARINDTHSYGLGWRDDARNADLGTRTVWHGGAAPGYQAALVLLPEAERAVVVLQNVYGYFHDSALIVAALNAARMVAGGEPVPAENAVGVDRIYPVLLVGFGAAVAAVLGAIGWTGYRLLRPAQRPGRGWRALATTAGWALGSAAVAYAAGIVAPKSFGVGLTGVLLWAPDVGWLAGTLTGGAIVLGVLRLAAGAVGWRRSTGST